MHLVARIPTRQEKDRTARASRCYHKIVPDVRTVVLPPCDWYGRRCGLLIAALGLLPNGLDSRATMIRQLPLCAMHTSSGTSARL